MATVPILPLGVQSWERAINAAQEVRDRALRFCRLLEDAGIAYAMAGGNAVATWVGTVDEGATRTTKDVDVLVRREDLPRIQAVAAAVGMVYTEALDVAMFLDHAEAKPSKAVHLLFAGEKVTPNDLVAAPAVTESQQGQEYWVVTLEALVRMKLTSYRLKDQVHLQDLLSVGLIDETWPARFPGELAVRLQAILENPNG